MNQIILEQTCEACPEQYWAYKGKHRIGYIRLRWGHFTCHYLPSENLSDNDIKLVDFVFENDEERNFWLEKSKQELLKYYNKNKKI